MRPPLYLACDPSHLGASQTCHGRGLPSQLRPELARAVAHARMRRRPKATTRDVDFSTTSSTRAPDLARSRNQPDSLHHEPTTAMHHRYVRFLVRRGVRPGRLCGSGRSTRRTSRRVDTPRADPVRSTALGRIEPQYPHLVVPLRQFLQVSLLRVYSPDGPPARAFTRTGRPETPPERSSGSPARYADRVQIFDYNGV